MWKREDFMDIKTCFGSKLSFIEIKGFSNAFNSIPLDFLDMPSLQEISFDSDYNISRELITRILQNLSQNIQSFVNRWTMR